MVNRSLEAGVSSDFYVLSQNFYDLSILFGVLNVYLSPISKCMNLHTHTCCAPAIFRRLDTFVRCSEREREREREDDQAVTRNAIVFNSQRGAVFSSQFSIFNSQFSEGGSSQFSILNFQFSILNFQFSIFNSQFSILRGLVGFAVLLAVWHTQTRLPAFSSSRLNNARKLDGTRLVVGFMLSINPKNKHYPLKPFVL